VTQKGGKTVESWAVESEAEPPSVTGSLFSMEWPTGSGKVREFPEVDQAVFFSLGDAREKLNPAQAGLLQELEELVGAGRA
jgi:predicted NUDIX family NTP pyrophosphohydrolase